MHKAGSEYTAGLGLTSQAAPENESEKSIRINTPREFGSSRGELLALFGTLMYRHGYQQLVTFEIASGYAGQRSEMSSPRTTIEIDFVEDPGFAALVTKLNTSTDDQTEPGHLRCFIPEDIRRLLVLDRQVYSPQDTVVLHFENIGGCRELILAYSAGNYDEKLIAALARHCETLLKSVVERPDLQVSKLEMMSTDELHHMWVEQNGATIEFVRQTIPGAFDEQVIKNPDAPALIYFGQTVTYQQLHVRAYALATRLQGYGIRLETPVGVFLDDPLAIAIAYFGIVMAGGVLVALDPEWPRERLEQVIAEAAMPFIITSAERARAIEPGTYTLLIYESLADLPQGATFQKPNLTPDNAAYVVFTSGSTGSPKGVVGLHRTLTSTPKMTRPLRTDEIIALSANLTFGAGVVGVFFPLLQGAAVLLVPHGVAQDLPVLVRTWEAARVTRITLVAPQLRQLLLLGTTVAARLKNITTVALAGAVLTKDMLPAIYELFPQAMVINAYTCLEVGTMTTRWETLPEERTRPLTLGRAVPNIQVYILGPKLNPLPVGMPGEICVGSADLSRGYLNRPDLTRERFLTNPFDASGTSRLYRTGDVGRFLPNGELEYLGRIDNQVKVRGIRIELEEIEASLQSHEAVHQAAVTAISQGADSRLTGFVSVKPGFTLRVSELRKYLGTRLPAYMVPPLFVIMDSLPMTSNGKIDRQHLPMAGATRPEIDTEYAAPRNKLEASLVAIWERELEITGIGRNDHFLEIGGDSLIGVRITIAIQELLGVDMPMVTLFAFPTIQSLAEELERDGSETASAREE